MRAVAGLLILAFSFGYAHEGHDDNLHQPSVIEKGKLVGKDQVVYLDAGAAIQWNGLKLKRKISELNQVIYQFNDEIKEQNEPATTDKSKYLELKVPGSESLKAFTFDHAGEMHDMIEMISPDFSNTLTIPKGKELGLRWKPDPTSSVIKVIIEVYDTAGKLIGRLTTSTTDDGEFDVPTDLLSQLPVGEGKIAFKRMWFGEFQPVKDKTEMIGLKSVMSVVGKAKVLDF